MSGVTSNIALAASAMNTHSWGMAVTAHNVANVSTAGFEPQRAAFATGPSGQGVRLDAILQGSGTAGLSGGATSAANAVFDVTSGLPLEAAAPSRTNLTREMAVMTSTQHAYEANAQVVHTSDAMLGTMLDIKA